MYFEDPNVDLVKKIHSPSHSDLCRRKNFNLTRSVCYEDHCIPHGFVRNSFHVD